MNQRQNELIRFLLLRQNETVQIKELAKQVGCAEKTIRNDLDRLEAFLAEQSTAFLVRKPGLGIAVNISEEERVKLLGTFFAIEHKQQDERLLEIAYELLTSQKAITLQAWAARYYVSKAVIKSDLEAIAGWLQQYRLTLVSKQRLGHVIEGAELHKRNALARLPELIPSLSHTKNVVLDLFMPHEISLVRKTLKDMQRNFSLRFADVVLESLEVHALIMIKRVRQQAIVFVHESEKAATYEQIEYTYARDFFHRLQEALRLRFPEEELVYFTWHLMSSKRLDEQLEKNIQYNEEVLKNVNDIIHKMSKLTLYHFEDDALLANGLALHMHAASNRMKYGFPITNPLLQQIKRMYPYLFNMVILTFEELHSTLQWDIPENEAAYIVLHFQAAIERMEGRRGGKKKALIVCHMGVGMSHLLEAKVTQHYETIDVVACVSQADMPQFLKKHDVDFIISTVPVENAQVDHIVISPLFSQQDKQALNHFVETLDKKRGTVGNGIVPFLHKDLVFFDVQKEHRFQVVAMLAESLHAQGYVSQDFIHSSVNRERKSATGVGGGVAIPHGDPAFIRQSALAVAIIKKPLLWGSEEVSLVFLLAVSKEQQHAHKDIIARIAALTEAPLVVHKLTASNDFDMFMSILVNDKN